MKTKIFGRELQSPIIIGSGPLSYSADGMIRLYEAGAGAVVTKTINRYAAKNPNRHMVACDTNTLINCEQWSDYAMDEWIDREIPKAVKAGVSCIASVGHTMEDSRLCVEALEREGCMAIELVSYSDDTILPMLVDTKKRVNIPVIVKLSPNSPNLLQLARACEEAGADAFTACDSIGPALKIDIETGKPLLGGDDGYGWLSGAMIRPFILQKVCELRKKTKLPIIGLGGIVKWQDAIEMLMAGADYVGVCSAPILKGVGYIQKLNEQMDTYFTTHNYQAIHQISGLVHKNKSEEEDGETYHMTYDPLTCRHCNRCIEVCPYQARRFVSESRMEINTEACRRCGLCVSICNCLSIEDKTRA
ncbi:MAG: 4Fe-4S dicluster domain-containing protein [Velocimicrobium sp.]